MALTLGTLEICVRALQTRESSYIARLARFFFMLEVCDLQETAGRVSALEPSRQGGRVQSLGHATALEPSMTVRRDPEP
jgi:hypothetical protein